MHELCFLIVVFLFFFFTHLLLLVNVSHWALWAFFIVIFISVDLYFTWVRASVRFVAILFVVMTTTQLAVIFLV